MTTALSIQNLSKTYTNGAEALRDISLEVRQGDFFGLLGPNGAGKSTLIRILCSLTRKTGGTVSVFDADIDRDFSRAKSYMGVVPQEFNFSLFENPMQVVLNQAGYHGIRRAAARPHAEELLRILGLWHKHDKQNGTLSGGMKRRLMIARAMVHRPQLLILDEPTAGLDIELRYSMWRYLGRINREGVTIILTTHYLEEAESLCRSIAIINEGRIVENTGTKQLLSRSNLETFIIDIEHTADDIPATTLSGLRRIDDTTLEVDVHKEQGLNRVFIELERLGIRALSMRNKTNRLENLFMRIVNNRPSAAPEKQ